MEFYIFIVAVLIILAITDLMVGVSNDAVNFLNSSIGSRVAPRYIIMIIASLGILAGVTFSNGMMEVARKGIFHPQHFVMPELMVIFLAVMLTDIVLLDLFNSFGLPTSTTVSIVFELLGAAVAVSLIKIMKADGNSASLGTYINTGKALAIISGILLSVVIAFVCGAIVQFFSRLLFTFDYKKRLKRYGALWGGIALSLIIYFILVKGSKGASFIGPETLKWIKSNSWVILTGTFVVSALVLQLLLIFSKINILKPIVLVGTFALAMAFAANDLVNFIGVPLAGLNAYTIAEASGEALTLPMEAMAGKVQSNTLLLLLAGAIMVATLWISKKARRVTKTEVELGRQDEGTEQYEASPLSRFFVGMFSSVSNSIKLVFPETLQNSIAQRLDQSNCKPDHPQGQEPPAFDLLRASVNLMVASAIVSMATSMKLPLSTTYVTFMVAMGTSFSDRAWGRESAVYRVTGVLTVIGGWFFTALMAFTVALIFAYPIYEFGLPAILVIIALCLLLIWRNHNYFVRKKAEEKAMDIFNLKKITDADSSIATTMEHAGIYINEINTSLSNCLEGLFAYNKQQLREAKRSSKNIQIWANIIVANIYKVLRLLRKKDVIKYTRTISALQEIADSHRDCIMRSHQHVANHHKGLLENQIGELRQMQEGLSQLLDKASGILLKKEIKLYSAISSEYKKLNTLAKKYDKNQVARIQDESSKTRLSILFYSIMWNSRKIAEQTISLLDIFKETFRLNGKK